MMQRPIITLSLLLVVALFPLSAQDLHQSQPAMFIRANDSFALDLLQKVHEEAPEQNTVVAPLPVSLSFAALWDGTNDYNSAIEWIKAFHWDKDFATREGGKMLFVRFAKPKAHATPRSPHSKDKNAKPLPDSRSKKAEELWLSAAVLYREDGAISRDFIRNVTSDYGIPFRAVSKTSPQSEVLAENWDPAVPMPKITGPNDFWITSFTHLRTSWAGNTFIDAVRVKHDFHLRSGDVVQADFLTSESAIYPYPRTEDFETVELRGLQATILFVLPSANSNIEKLEKAFAKNPSLVEPLLSRSEGYVRLPPFHFSSEVNLRNSLEKMGIHRIFEDTQALGVMFPGTGGALSGVAQKTEVTVDENGFRADSGTVLSGVLGGIMAVKLPFQMILDRPFLFIIRDNVTHEMLFAGVVVNPTQP
jgi:serine protease inhibitor